MSHGTRGAQRAKAFILFALTGTPALWALKLRLALGECDPKLYCLRQRSPLEVVAGRSVHFEKLPGTCPEEATSTPLSAAGSLSPSPTCLPVTMSEWIRRQRRWKTLLFKVKKNPFRLPDAGVNGRLSSRGGRGLFISLNRSPRGRPGGPRRCRPESSSLDAISHDPHQFCPPPFLRVSFEKENFKHIWV